MSSLGFFYDDSFIAQNTAVASNREPVKLSVTDGTNTVKLPAIVAGVMNPIQLPGEPTPRAQTWVGAMYSWAQGAYLPLPTAPESKRATPANPLEGKNNDTFTVTVKAGGHRFRAPLVLDDTKILEGLRGATEGRVGLSKQIIFDSTNATIAPLINAGTKPVAVTLVLLGTYIKKKFTLDRVFALFGDTTRAPVAVMSDMAELSEAMNVAGGQPPQQATEDAVQNVKDELKNLRDKIVQNGAAGLVDVGDLTIASDDLRVAWDAEVTNVLDVNHAAPGPDATYMGRLLATSNFMNQYQLVSEDVNWETLSIGVDRKTLSLYVDKEALDTTSAAVAANASLTDADTKAEAFVENVAHLLYAGSASDSSKKQGNAMFIAVSGGKFAGADIKIGDTVYVTSTTTSNGKLVIGFGGDPSTLVRVGSGYSRAMGLEERIKNNLQAAFVIGGTLTNADGFVNALANVLRSNGIFPKVEVAGKMFKKAGSVNGDYDGTDFTLADESSKTLIFGTEAFYAAELQVLDQSDQWVAVVFQGASMIVPVWAGRVGFHAWRYIARALQSEGNAATRFLGTTKPEGFLASMLSSVGLSGALDNREDLATHAAGARSLQIADDTATDTDDGSAGSVSEFRLHVRVGGGDTVISAFSGRWGDSKDKNLREAHAMVPSIAAIGTQSYLIMPSQNKKIGSVSAGGISLANLKGVDRGKFGTKLVEVQTALAPTEKNRVSFTGKRMDYSPAPATAPKKDGWIIEVANNGQWVGLWKLTSDAVETDKDMVIDVGGKDVQVTNNQGQPLTDTVREFDAEGYSKPAGVFKLDDAGANKKYQAALQSKKIEFSVKNRNKFIVVPAVSTWIIPNASGEITVPAETSKITGVRAEAPEEGVPFVVHAPGRTARLTDAQAAAAPSFESSAPLSSPSSSPSSGAMAAIAALRGGHAGNI